MSYTLLQQTALQLAECRRLNRQTGVLLLFSWLVAAVTLAVAVYSNW